jgi:RNA polymerase sigma-70 factor (ECF subfamily)
MVRRHIARRVRDPSLREDIEQEFWFVVHRIAPEFRGDSRVSTWLVGVLANVVRSGLRREVRRSAREERMREPRDYAPPTDEVADHARTLRRLRAALKGLPPKRRVAVLLHAVDGAAMTEIAGMTGQPVGTVKSGHFYGLRVVRKCLS